MDANDRKFRELILYISMKSEGDDTFGAVKLNKLLFNADFLAFKNFGQSITGQEYLKLQQGPAPRRLVVNREEMKKAGEIAIRERDFYGKEQHRILALREPDINLFSAREISLVDDLILRWWGISATAISNASHEFVGWRLAQEKETIPYETILVDSREPTDDEIRRGMELESEASSCRSA